MCVPDDPGDVEGQTGDSQLGPEAGAEAAGRGSELGGGSVRPLDVQVTAGVMRPIRCELHICL